MGEKKYTLTELARALGQRPDAVKYIALDNDVPFDIAGKTWCFDAAARDRLAECFRRNDAKLRERVALLS